MVGTNNSCKQLLDVINKVDQTPTALVRKCSLCGSTKNYVVTFRAKSGTHTSRKINVGGVKNTSTKAGHLSIPNEGRICRKFTFDRNLCVWTLAGLLVS